MTAIVFEQLAAGTTPPPPGVMIAPLRLGASASDIAALHGVLSASLELGFAQEGPAPPAPSYSVLAGTLGFGAVFWGASEIPEAVLAGSLSIGCYAYETPDFVRAELGFLGFLVGPSPVMPPVPPVGLLTIATVNAIAGSGVPSTFLLGLANAVIAATMYDERRWIGQTTIEDSVAFEDALIGVVMVLIEEGVVLDGVVTATPQNIGWVIERLVLDGTVATVVDAIQMIVEGLTLSALIYAAQIGSLSDSVVMSDTIQQTVCAMMELVESMVAQDALTPAYTAIALVSDTMVLSDVATGIAHLTMLLQESIGFMLRLSLDNGEYLAWVLNTKNKGLSRYANYPYNSFAKIGSNYFGAADDGIYQLVGSDDNGTDIAAQVRAGLSDLGNRRLKRLPDAYIALTTNGTVLLQVIQVADDGTKQACLYKMTTPGASVKREGRFKIGRGMKSVDWDFVLENVDGSAFDLRSLSFHPLMLDRRTRGNFET